MILLCTRKTKRTLISKSEYVESRAYFGIVGWSYKNKKNRTSSRSSAMCLRADKDQPKLFTCKVTLDLMLAALFLWIMLFLANLSSIV